MAPSYILPTKSINSDHPDIIRFSQKICQGSKSQIDKAVSLYYGVRDGIRYNPYSLPREKKKMRASRILDRGEGYCVAKAVVLAACLRSCGIPARLGFADVRNHLTTGRLREMMETDLFVWHGYTDVFLEGRWVKATPAFNLSLCEAFHVRPLEFDGRSDSIFHPFDTRGRRHMEYINDHGAFEDLPWERIIADCVQAYPRFFALLGKQGGDFTAEARAENRKGRQGSRGENPKS